jgi:hypothetical protein
MSAAAIATLVKMVESLPDELQEKVVEHIRDYIADLEDEKRWDTSFQRTQGNLVAAARKAKQEIAAGQSVPMDYEQLLSLQRYPLSGRDIEN